MKTKKAIDKKIKELSYPNVKDILIYEAGIEEGYRRAKEEEAEGIHTRNTDFLVDRAKEEKVEEKPKFLNEFISIDTSYEVLGYSKCEKCGFEFIYKTDTRCNNCKRKIKRIG